MHTEGKWIRKRRQWMLVVNRDGWDLGELKKGLPEEVHLSWRKEGSRSPRQEHACVLQEQQGQQGQGRASQASDSKWHKCRVTLHRDCRAIERTWGFTLSEFKSHSRILQVTSLVHFTVLIVSTRTYVSLPYL